MSGSSSTSSRRGKKSANEKPRQPQRGLGVAQLEKMRLHSQIEEMKMQAFAAMQSYQYGYPPNHPIFIRGIEDMERSQQRFVESQAYNQAWWNPSHVLPGSHPYGPYGEMATRHFLNSIEDPDEGVGNNGWFGEMAGSSSANSNDSEDLDLELKL